jgi:hypothetical protein
MTAQSILEDTKIFLEHLGLAEEPFGVYYGDTLPEKAFGPKPGITISRELEDQGQLDMQEVFNMKPDELTFTVSLSLYKKMLKALPESMFNVGGAWTGVRKKIRRSAKVWGEDN